MKMANYLFDKKQQQQQKNEIEPKEVLKSAAPMDSHKRLVFPVQSFWSSWSRVDLKVYSEIKIGNNIQSNKIKITK